MALKRPPGAIGFAIWIDMQNDPGAEFVVQFVIELFGLLIQAVLEWLLQPKRDRKGKEERERK